MNMSDDVAGATVQVSTKVAEKTIEVTSQLVNKTIDNIDKLFRLFLENSKNKSKDTKKSDDIKSGEVAIKELIQNAKKNNQSISISEQGLTLQDKKFLTQKSKEYGMPIAFTGTKDNIYANIRADDVNLFQRMCTDMLKSKVAERPQELGNFKVKEWEIPFITSELNKYDLSAQFGKTENNENFCLYEKSDEKAILIARNEFVRKCDELKKDFTVDKDENGFYTLKDIHSEEEISFDSSSIPSRSELAEKINQVFGYDKNKTNLACAKFGEENLQGKDKLKFFSDSPIGEFSKVSTNIELKGEDIYVKPYTCWRVTPKSDSIPKIVFRDNETGSFAVLNPEKMTHQQMKDILSSQLQLNDEKTLASLVNKAEKVNSYYIAQNKNNFSHISNGINTEIERKTKDNFVVKNSGHTLVLSFSDKKKSLARLEQLYKELGISEDSAKEIAKEIFHKAEMQSPEKVVQIEKIKAEKITVSVGATEIEVDTTDKEKAVEEISEKLEVSEETAQVVIEKSEEIIQESNTEIQAEEIDFSEDEIPPMPPWNFSENDIPPEINSFDMNIPEVPNIPVPRKR